LVDLSNSRNFSQRLIVIVPGLPFPIILSFTLSTGNIFLEVAVAKIIADGGFSGMAAMGQVMGAASKVLAGQADGKTI